MNEINNAIANFFDVANYISKDGNGEQVKVKVLAHSINAYTREGLITFSLSYQRFFHSEVMTHRMAGKNASSSRAIPVKRMNEKVRTAPAMPIFWGKNQAGMQAYEANYKLVKIPEHLQGAFNHFAAGAYLSDYSNVPASIAWKFAASLAADMSDAFAEAEYHKQITNRITEPYQHISVIFTATTAAMAAIYELRDHHAAQPEFQLLAREMKLAQSRSVGKYLHYGEWHLPYVEQDLGIYLWNGEIISLDEALECSAAACARVSYNNHDGTPATLEKNFELYNQLIRSKPMHASPIQHQATPDMPTSVMRGWLTGRKYQNEHLHGELTGWIQNRKLVELGLNPNKFQ